MPCDRHRAWRERLPVRCSPFVVASRSAVSVPADATLAAPQPASLAVALAAALTAATSLGGGTRHASRRDLGSSFPGTPLFRFRPEQARAPIRQKSPWPPFFVADRFRAIVALAHVLRKAISAHVLRISRDADVAVSRGWRTIFLL